MELNDLFRARGIDAEKVLVMRHSPTERQLRKAMPWLAQERPEVYNAYQQTQPPKVALAMQNATHIASFIGNAPGRALYVGLYKRGESKTLNHEAYWADPLLLDLNEFGHVGLTDAQDSCIWVDLTKTDFYSDWMGRLVIRWPEPAISWCRWAGRNQFQVEAIHDTNVLNREMQAWDQLVLGWTELKALPQAWRARLAEWRGIYLILDESDGKTYVGSASGEENILGRWLSYACTGHGGNVQLRDRDPKHFRYSILQRVSPDTERAEVERIEKTWKDRLHTREFGLNGN